jgi:hypothetical protein
MRTMPRPRFPIPPRGAAFALAAAAAFGFWAASLPSGPPIRFACARFDPVLIYGRIPGCSGWGERGGRRVRMAYNALGLRDRDYPAGHPRGTRRVLLLGGSMIAGSGLEETEAPPRAFERSLLRRGLRAEVINGAGEGATTLQNAARLRGALKAYKPDAVVYHLASSYLVADRAWRDDLLTLDGAVAGVQPMRSPGRAQARLAWNVVRVSRALAAIPDEDRRLDDLLEPTLRELAQMRELSLAAGAEFAVAFDGEDVDTTRGDERRAANGYGLAVRLPLRALTRSLRFSGAAIEERLRRAGLSVLALDADRPALEAPGNRLSQDYHWNPAGAVVFGDALAREFVRARR